MSFNYLHPGTKVELREEPMTKEEAINLKLVPLSMPIFYPSEHWILYNMREDCRRLKINYALVMEKNSKQLGLSLWKATNNLKNR